MRKASVVYAILVVGLLTASFMIYGRVKEADEVADRNLAAEKLKRDYLEKVSWVRSNPDERQYLEELRPFLRDYFSQVDEQVKRFNLNAKFDDFPKALANRVQNEKPAPDETAARALYEKVQQTFSAMREGRYAPFATATDRGMRLDIVSADLRAEAGNQIVMPIALWGAQRELREDRQARTHKVVASVTFDAVWKLFDASGKFINEIRAGDPSIRVDYPERFISFFPPQMVLGEYKLDRVPAEAEKVTLTVDVGTRAQWGSSGRGTFTFTFPVKREWKLAPGEEWKGAEVSERSEDEIRPPAAAKK